MRAADFNSFNQMVYQLVRQIPKGRVTSYGAIARALGDPRKAREVGWALYAKPEGEAAPAHRVVNREGKLSGGWAFGSPDVQRKLLEAEGVGFLPDGSVDLSTHMWWPDDNESHSESAQPSLF